MIRLVTQRPKAVASRAKQSEIVDLQLTNQIPDLHYPTIPYNTYITIHCKTKCVVLTQIHVSFDCPLKQHTIHVCQISSVLIKHTLYSFVC